MRIEENLKYTKEHEWLRVEDDTGIVGITDYAQEQLKDIVFIELPQIGKKLKKGETLATLEAVKTVADIFSPVSGEVIEVNKQLLENPQFINEDPYGKGWVAKIKISDKNELKSLMGSQEYEKFLKTLVE
jgi:glycine cleavage system H protein